ncbi:MAG: hypothetical protein H0V58_02380 [Actinobacteria bacterium]|nr:hypothetical protein [Actinomycetota bacterium]
MRTNRYVAAAATGAVALLIGGGAAFAGQSPEDKGARCEARLAKIAEKHGTTVAQVETRLKERLTARIDAALRSGGITAERAAMLKERIAEGSLCRGAQALKAKHRRYRLLAAAAEFLGLDRAELRAALPGTSLSALAERREKSVAGLKAAMIAPVQAKLAKAVGGRRISQERADTLLDRLGDRVERIVARVFPARS